ncbi:unnamed protein product [Bursaphelenchus okinawaensis]|uniref:RNase NYN domain-containing protein n=1 Tax=Bursaphelenchus okinawaensis TaxID=465554 RepID=A0A811JQL1_9BILA|nr:unnamed protein product [Bursaphelenchus okinawaensis]CAG9078464.1 unnamed protein product [Bursaphelenchus okinawaensis]
MSTTRSRKPREEVKPETELDKYKWYETVWTPEEFKTAEFGVKRRVVIDGCNFIYNAGNKAYDVHCDNDKFNPVALLILVYDLMEYGFDVHVYIKQYFKNEAKAMDKTTVNEDIINELEALEIATVLPDQVDDDKAALEDAEKTGAIILSLDKYKQKAYDGFKSRSRRCGFNVVTTGPPKDMCSFEARLHCSIKIVLDEEFRWTSYVLPGEEDYVKVQNCEKKIDIKKRMDALQKMDVLADWYFLECAIYSKAVTEDDIKKIQESIPYYNKKFKLTTKFKKFYDTYLTYQGSLL